MARAAGPVAVRRRHSLAVSGTAALSLSMLRSVLANAPPMTAKSLELALDLTSRGSIVDSPLPIGAMNGDTGEDQFKIYQLAARDSGRGKSSFCRLSCARRRRRSKVWPSLTERIHQFDERIKTVRTATRFPGVCSRSRIQYRSALPNAGRARPRLAQGRQDMCRAGDRWRTAANRELRDLVLPFINAVKRSNCRRTSPW